MAKGKSKKRKLLKKAGKSTQSEKKAKLEKAASVVKEEDSDDDFPEQESESEKIQRLLEPYTKDQLIEFICDAAMKDSSLSQRIRDAADRDISHRKIFVFGLAWSTTRETLTSAFQSYGEIEDCNVVTDRVTGRAKGYGFVLFKSRAGATKALKQPRKKINNRVASCQLASIGPVHVNQQYQDTTGRKVYVSNVHTDVDPEKLRAFFEKFGEIETGPLGFDLFTGKSRGFALFVYKTQEGARKAIQEPYKMFEGHQLHCQMATENKNKPGLQNAQAPVLAAMAAAQNMAMFGQHSNLNPAYIGLAASPHAGLVSGSPMVGGAFNPGLISSSQMAGSSLGNATGLGATASHGLSGLGGNNPSMLGVYGANATALQGLHSFQNAYLGQSSRAFPTSGPLSGYPSYM